MWGLKLKEGMKGVDDVDFIGNGAIGKLHIQQSGQFAMV